MIELADDAARQARDDAIRRSDPQRARAHPSASGRASRPPPRLRLCRTRFYADQVEPAYRLFGRDKIHTLLSADLRARPERPLGDLAKSLGVTFETKVMRARIVHESAIAQDVLSTTDIACLDAVFADDVRRLFDLTGIVVPSER